MRIDYHGQIGCDVLRLGNWSERVGIGKAGVHDVEVIVDIEVGGKKWHLRETINLREESSINRRIVGMRRRGKVKAH